MKIVQGLANQKTPIVAFDPALDQLRNKELFPAKLAKAEEMLKTAKLPARKPSR